MLSGYESKNNRRQIIQANDKKCVSSYPKNDESTTLFLILNKKFETNYKLKLYSRTKFVIVKLNDRPMIVASNECGDRLNIIEGRDSYVP